MLVIAVVWAVAWLPVGLGLALYAAQRSPQPYDILARPVPVPLFAGVWSAWGAVSGAMFALVLRIAERRRTVETLSAARLAVWGAIGAASLPSILLAVDYARVDPGLRGYGWEFAFAVVVVSAGVGAACAAATLALARRR